MGDYFGSPNLGNKKKLNSRQPFTVFLLVVKMKLIEEGLGVSLKQICVGRGKFVFVFDERICSLIHEKDVNLRRYAEIRINKVHIPGVFAAGTCLQSFARRGSTVWCLLIMFSTLCSVCTLL